TQYHDGTAPSNFKMLSAEDRAFLEKAMVEAFGEVEDTNGIMKEAAAKITADDRTDESITVALEVIDYCCDNPDCARNAEKLGVLQPMLDVIGTHPGAIRTRALEVLALLFSNNKNIQEAGIKRGALQALVNLTK
ncbi:unnamed protein product, partial [Polarella glacialis]